jgi:aminoglycoside 3-N-acetyltransferase
MIQRVKTLVPKELQPHLAPAYHRMGGWLARLDRAFDKRSMSQSQFLQLLEELGVTAGATVMVHSSMDKIARRVPDVNPFRLIQLLQQLLGPEGTLLMPTFPFEGPQLHYVEAHDTFDPRKTPSRVGVMPEVFRRMPGVIRSLHPTHSVAAWGKHASEMLATHHLGTTFGPSSPIYKLRDHGGLVVGLGAGLSESFTIQHVAEELHPKTRSYAYEKEPRVMTIINGPDKIRYEFYVLKPEIEGKFARIERILLKDGTLKCINRKGLQCAVTHADEFITRSLELIDRNMYLF